MPSIVLKTQVPGASLMIRLGSTLVLNDCALKNLPLGDFDDRFNLGAMGLERSDRLTLCFLFLPLKGQPCRLDLSLRFLVIHT